MNRRDFMSLSARSVLAVPAVSHAADPVSVASQGESVAGRLDEKGLRQLFASAVARSGAIGAQMSIIKGDEQLDLAAGFAHLERRIPMTAGTLMQIGSITKVLNSMLAVSLAQDGHIDLEAPIRTYLPDFAVADAQASREISLRHLTSMCSGLDDGIYALFGGGEDALGKFIEHLRSLPQRFQPGRYFGYSNAGACVAGHVSARVGGKPWETLLRERILQPADLNEVALLEADVLYQQVAAGHARSADGKVRIVDPVFTMARACAPSGISFAMSTRQLARFGKLFLRGGRSDNGSPVVSGSSIELMSRPQITVPTRKYADHWCIGPCMGNWNGVQVWGHGGTSDTATSFMYWAPERNGLIAFMVNHIESMGEFANVAFDEILNASLGFRKSRFDLPDTHARTPAPARFVGTYESLETRMTVATGPAKSLTARMVDKQDGSEKLIRLKPLGGDRFLIEEPGGPDRHRGVLDMAFFGVDERGRATNALDLVFAMSRVPDRDS